MMNKGYVSLRHMHHLFCSQDRGKLALQSFIYVWLLVSFKIKVNDVCLALMCQLSDASEAYLHSMGFSAPKDG